MATSSWRYYPSAWPSGSGYDEDLNLRCPTPASVSMTEPSSIAGDSRTPTPPDSPTMHSPGLGFANGIDYLPNLLEALSTGSYNQVVVDSEDLPLPAAPRLRPRDLTPDSFLAEPLALEEPHPLNRDDTWNDGTLSPSSPPSGIISPPDTRSPVPRRIRRPHNPTPSPNSSAYSQTSGLRSTGGSPPATDFNATTPPSNHGIPPPTIADQIRYDEEEQVDGGAPYVVEAVDLQPMNSNGWSEAGKEFGDTFEGKQEFVMWTSHVFNPGRTRVCGNNKGCNRKYPLTHIPRPGMLPAMTSRSSDRITVAPRIWEQQNLTVFCDQCDILYCRGCWQSRQAPLEAVDGIIGGCVEPASCHRRHALAIYEILCMVDERFLGITPQHPNKRDRPSPWRFLRLNAEGEKWSPNLVMFMSALRHLEFYVSRMENPDPRQDYTWLIHHLFGLSWISRLIRMLLDETNFRDNIQEKYKDIYVALLRLLYALYRIDTKIIAGRKMAALPSTQGLRASYGCGLTDRIPPKRVFPDQCPLIISGLWQPLFNYTNAAYRSDQYPAREWDWLEGEGRDCATKIYRLVAGGT